MKKSRPVPSVTIRKHPTLMLLVKGTGLTTKIVYVCLFREQLKRNNSREVDGHKLKKLCVYLYRDLLKSNCKKELT